MKIQQLVSLSGNLEVQLVGQCHSSITVRPTIKIVGQESTCMYGSCVITI